VEGIVLLKQPIFKQVERKNEYSRRDDTEIKDILKDNFSVSWSDVLRSDESVINEWKDGGYKFTNVTKCQYNIMFGFF
jgi:beta-glucosidase